jgi:hypothetical protein
MTARPLSERAKHRLKIAAGLLRGMGRKLDFPRDQFYERIQQELAALGEDERATLKELTDWVEAYDRADSARSAANEFLKRGKSRDQDDTE